MTDSQKPVDPTSPANESILQWAVPKPIESTTQPPSPVWDANWDKETARLAYEHAREVYRQIDAATDVMDRKAVTVFTIASAIGVLGPGLARFPLWSSGWWLGIGAVLMWAGAAIQCIRAFSPRRYRLDPNIAAMATPDWLSLSPGEFYLKRLLSVRRSVWENLRTLGVRGAALSDALECALVEVGFLLAALLLR